MKAIACVKPVALLGAALVLASCARDVAPERTSPEGRDIGPGLWRYFEPLAAGGSRDPLLERVKELAGRESRVVPRAPAGVETPASGEAPSTHVSAANAADAADDKNEGDKLRSILGDASLPLPLSLGPGDEVDIVVDGQPEFSGHVTIRADGKLALPTTGDLVEAADLTTAEVAFAVAGAIHPRYLKSTPEVSVSLRSSSRLVYYVLGAVRRPGIYTMPPAGITVLDAVLAASRETDAPGGRFEPVNGARYGRVHVVTPAGRIEEGVKFRIVDVAKGIRGEPGPREVVPPGSRVIVPMPSGEFSEAALRRELYPEGSPSPEKGGGGK